MIAKPQWFIRVPKGGSARLDPISWQGRIYIGTVVLLELIFVFLYMFGFIQGILLWLYAALHTFFFVDFLDAYAYVKLHDEKKDTGTTVCKKDIALYVIKQLILILAFMVLFLPIIGKFYVSDIFGGKTIFFVCVFLVAKIGFYMRLKNE